MRRLVLCLGLMVLLVPAADVSAIPITSGYSTEGLGSFEADFVYTAAESGETATITISITNTSSASNGGYMTGIVFNNPASLLDGVSSVDFPASQWQLLPSEDLMNDEILADDTVSGQPFGYFDLGVALGGNFLGGASPDLGLAVDETGVFTFNLTGTNLDDLTALDFVNELSTGSEGQFFLARFRGFDDGGSDKVGGVYEAQPGGGGGTEPPDGGPMPPAAPEPTTALFMAVGLLASGSLRRKLR